MSDTSETSKQYRQLRKACVVSALLFILVSSMLIIGISPVFSTPKPTLQFRLLTHHGHLLNSADLIDTPTAIFFGFSRCATICGTTLQTLTLALNEIPPAQAPTALFIAVDPLNDTEKVLNTYLQNYRSLILGLTGTTHALDPVYESFQVYIDETQPNSEARLFNHSGWIYLCDANNQFIRHFVNSIDSGQLKKAIYELASIKRHTKAELFARWALTPG